MFISFAASRSGGFKSWSDAHPSTGNDDNDSSGANVVALAVPSFDDVEVVEQPGCPWVVPDLSVSL
jgi:hypothetical protein